MSQPADAFEWNTWPPPREARGEAIGGAAPRSLSVRLARGPAELLEAQRLRYAVFAGEMGARIGDPDGGIDRDEFDGVCEHLIVRDEEAGIVAGTYRILSPQGQQRIGRLYADAEFDLQRLAPLRPTLVEVGRSCVHPDYRDGPVILMLWAGLAQYLRRGRFGHLIGCASASLADGGGQAAALRDHLQAFLAPEALRAFPRLPFPAARVARAGAFEMPPLIKGYLRLGARICGEPAWDPDFNSADFLVWLALENMAPRYARHFDLLAARAGPGAGAGAPAA
jgi:putative hemolysin